MTITTLHQPRTREPICPPWCTGHTEIFCGWEQRTDGGPDARFHDEDGGNRIGGGAAAVAEMCSASQFTVSIELYAEERRGQALRATLVSISLDNDYSLLTPGEARAAAARLLEAADVAERVL